MRIWDINPGYLNRQSLLGEHRELHGIVSIIVNGKKGYSKHPETLRWVGYEWALKMRHELLAAEMSLRGFNEKTPVMISSNEGKEGVWPEEYIDAPREQFTLLAGKYKKKKQGRIPLPKNGQQVWSQHKYSVMARNVPLYKKIGREVANISSLDSTDEFSALAALLTK
ncbi:Pyrimidine dimer DNA glycosylase; DNA-(apurinic or apyrimidinic site) lyase, partial [Candidatus Electrothrix communis]